MYEYVWYWPALEQLADLYVAATADERKRMASGVEAFNAQLAADPFALGESRDGPEQVAFPPLLRVAFEIDKVRGRVVVTGVVRYGR